MKISLSKRSEIRWINYIRLYFCLLCINLFLQIGIELPASVFAIIKIGIKGVLIIYLIYVVLRTKEKSFFRILIFAFGIISAVFLKSFLLGYADPSVLKTNFVNIITIYLPLFTCAASIDDTYQFFEKFIPTARVIGIITSLTMYLYASKSVRNYDSSSGYLALVAATVLFYSYKKNRTVLDLLLSLVAMIVAIALGSRGGMICVLGVVLLSIITLGRLSKKKIMACICCFFVLMLIVLNLESIVDILPESLIGRNATVLLGANNAVTGFLDSNGRLEIWSYYWDLALKYPIFGSGVFGNYMYLFPHNIFLEILASEGLIVGVAIVLFITIKSFKPLFVSDYRDVDKFIYLAFSVAFFEVLLSTDFLLNEMWWVFLGISFSLCRRYRKNRNNVRKVEW